MAITYLSRQSFSTAIDQYYQTDTEGLGTLRYDQDNGKVYRWVSTAVNVAQYDCVVEGASNNLVTIVYGTVATTAPVGLAQIAVPAASAGITLYFWVQVGGEATATTDGNVAAGCTVVCDALGTDGEVTIVTPGTDDQQRIGTSAAADVVKVGTVVLKNLV